MSLTSCTHAPSSGGDQTSSTTFISAKELDKLSDAVDASFKRVYEGADTGDKTLIDKAREEKTTATKAYETAHQMQRYPTNTLDEGTTTGLGQSTEGMEITRSVETYDGSLNGMRRSKRRRI